MDLVDAVMSNPPYDGLSAEEQLSVRSALLPQYLKIVMD
jgi:hypothetical protein